jgi:hypothetical protein
VLFDRTDGRLRKTAAGQRLLQQAAIVILMVLPAIALWLPAQLMQAARVQSRPSVLHLPIQEPA